MTISCKIHEQVTALFLEHSCWTIDALATELEYSIISVRRFLTAIGYYRSFTHNGKWYTLSTIPKFNRDGLWFHQDKGFSRAGSLTKAVIKLAENSPAGITADQLGEKFHCRCHTLLVQLYRNKKVQRQKVGRSFVYFAADSQTASKQRQIITSANAQKQKLPAEIAVFVLVEFINNPGASFAQLVKIIKYSKNVSVTISQIKALFKQHALKKTLPTAEQPLGRH